MWYNMRNCVSERIFGKGEAALKKLALVLLAAVLLLLFAACEGEKTPAETAIPIPADTADHDAFVLDDGVITYPGALQGIDVSEHQGEIDWQKVAADGIDFAILRVGYRGTGREGKLMPDPRFEENYAGATEAGLSVGVYFYSQAISVSEAEEEAAFVLGLLRGRSLQLPVFFDWEESSGRTSGSSKSAVSGYALAFSDLVKEEGYETGTYFYASLGFRLDLGRLLEGSFWLSQPDELAFPYAVQFWQYSFEGRVDGIDTVVDRDLMYQKGDRP